MAIAPAPPPAASPKGRSAHDRHRARGAAARPWPDDGVIAALGKGREARVHIAAKKLDPQVGPALQQDRLAADRGGADNRAMRQRIRLS